MDTGTVKMAPMRAAAHHRGSFDFVGLHPLAGSEGHGWDAASANLFAGRQIVYCTASPGRFAASARELIVLLGAVPLKMDAKIHDQFGAAAIGLPHILAFAARGYASKSKKANLLRGSSWESLARVAASDPAMVAGFLSANASEQIKALKQFQRHLDRITKLLTHPDEKRLEQVLRSMAGT